MEKQAGCKAFTLCCSCLCFVSLPDVAKGWSAFCCCGISRLYLLPQRLNAVFTSNTIKIDHECEVWINRIHHWCSVGTEKIPTRGPTVPVGNEACRVSHWTVDPRVGIFWNHWTPMIDSFSHIPRPYGTVLRNICWWRHWDRCLQSMTRAVQINLKQRTNSALNNEQMVISSKWI